MTEQASRINVDCAQCAGPGEGWAIQRIADLRLRWETEWVCDRCGIAHDGDWGTAPEFVRDVLVAEHGHHRLRVSGTAAPSGKVLKAFREAFACSLGDAKAFSEAARSEGYVGTYVETSLVERLLRRSGVDASVEPDRTG
ncbi:hypothetical protein [Streptomyces sp. NPDC003247]|uniref:hypothetical protein n=1 Tax=Streptomyces sp. NPDC003247 TaxID=3364677 RepID=UPI003696E710